MKRTLLFGLAIVIGGLAQAQTATNVILRGTKTYTNDLNDVWGYADSNGNEYALVGVRNGFSVVDVTNPSTPIEQFFISGKSSVWRDIKTWDHYAYVMHDYASGSLPNMGLMIVDLDSMTTPRYKTMNPFVDTAGIMGILTRSHNLWVDEQGYLYIFGGDVGAGGAIVMDVATDPWNPTVVGAFNGFYLHDGFVKGDTLYGAGLNNGTVILDMTNKAQPSYLGQFTTPSNFAHNCWLSEDGKTLFTTDEVTSGYVAAYDVSDLSNISETDKWRVGDQTIPHNAHVYGNVVVTSYYTYGLHIMDYQDPAWLIEVGHYDSSPLSGDGYNGAWGAYPYLPSGNCLITDIEEGLFVVTPSYTEAARVYAYVQDSVSGAVVGNAEVAFSIDGDTIPVDGLTGHFRRHKIGSFVDTVTISAPGYRTLKTVLVYTEAVLDTQYFKLLPEDFSVGEGAVAPVLLTPNPAVNTIHLSTDLMLHSDAEIHIVDLSGRIVHAQSWQNGVQNTVHFELPSGVYAVEIVHANFHWTEKLIVE